ncbi:MAG TPA: hypothetical protein VIU61_29105 [Kofleriaceae bacterium]
MAGWPILTLIVCSAVAHASPRTDPTTGRAVFTGATVPHATSISLNPSALGLGAINEIYAAFTATADQVGVDRESGESVSDTLFAPGGMVAVIYHPGDRATVGGEIRTTPNERFLDHEALQYHSRGGGQRDLYISIGSSIRATSSLYFGASVTHNNTKLRLRYTRDTALERGVDGDCGGEPCGFENPLAAERYDVDVDSPTIGTSNIRLNVGFIARIYRGVWLGIAYHTPPGFKIQSQLDGEVTVEKSPRDGGRILTGGSQVNVHFPASVDGEIRARLIADLDLHVGGRWEDLSRMQSYDVRAYSSTLRAEGIPEWTLRPRGFHDSFALWGGVEQVDTGQRIRLGGRIGVETSSTTTERISPTTIAPTSITADLGLQYRVTPGLIFQLSYGLQFFPPSTIEDSAFDPQDQVDCIASGYDYSTAACESVRQGYAIPSAAGDYSRYQHAFRVGLRYELP